MTQCVSVRKQGSTDQCPSLALRGLSFCGKHARMKTPVLWADVQKKCDIVSIQALVRGWLIRKRLRLAGKGVLRRDCLENEDEPFQYRSKDKCHPLDYVSIEENGKVWWFEATSVWKWVIRSPEPTNPYTRTPLTPETRKRIREVWIANHKPSVWASTASERLRERWNVLCQIFTEYGFVDVDPSVFLELHTEDYLSMFILLYRDLQTVLPERYPQRDRLLRLCQNVMNPCNTDSRYPLICTYTLLFLLTIPKDSYLIAFTILSALYRC